MVCQTCHRFTTHRLLCDQCRRLLIPANDRLVGVGVRLVSGFEHVGPARPLVHHLKYRGLTDYANLVAATVQHRLPALPFVPIPRAISRQLRYGVDPAMLLAQRLAQAKGTTVIRALAPPPHAPRRAGGDHESRVEIFDVRRPPQAPVIVVDDVFTTGATLDAAFRSLGPDQVLAAVVANVVPEVSSLLRSSPPKTNTQL